MDVMDLFEDGPNFDARSELDKINKELEENDLKCHNLAEEIKRLQEKNAKLEETQRKIKANFNSFMDDIRHELSEKDNKVITLRREKDDLAFRRAERTEIRTNTVEKGSQTATLEELTGDPTLALGYGRETRQTLVDDSREGQRSIKQEAVASETTIQDNRPLSSEDNKSRDKSDHKRDHHSRKSSSSSRRREGTSSGREERNSSHKRTRDDRNSHREGRDESRESKSTRNGSEKRKSRDDSPRRSHNGKTRTSSKSSSSDSQQPTKKSRIDEVKSDKRRDNPAEVIHKSSSAKTLPLTVKVENIKREYDSTPSLDYHERRIRPGLVIDQVSPGMHSNMPSSTITEEEPANSPFDSVPKDLLDNPSSSPNQPLPTSTTRIATPPTPVSNELSPVPLPDNAKIPSPPPATATLVAEAKPRVEKRSEPLLTTFEGSLKLLDKEGMFVKIKSNRASNVLDDNSATTPLDGVNTSSSSNELHLQVSDNCSSSPPLLSQTGNKSIGSPAVEKMEISHQIVETPPHLANREYQHEMEVCIEAEDPRPSVAKPKNIHPHNHPVTNKLPMMTVPQTSPVVFKQIQEPDSCSEQMVEEAVKPEPPKPKINFVSKFADEPSKKPTRDSNLTVANLQGHDQNMRKNEISYLDGEFKKLINTDDPQYVMAKERVLEKMEQKKVSLDLAAPSTIAQSDLNVDLVAGTDSKGNLAEQKPAAGSPQTPNPQKGNSKQTPTIGTVKLEDVVVKVEPPAEKCVTLGNSQYNITKDAEGTTVIHLKRFKRRTR